MSSNRIATQRVTQCSNNKDVHELMFSNDTSVKFGNEASLIQFENCTHASKLLKFFNNLQLLLQTGVFAKFGYSAAYFIHRQSI